jgi:methanogenic corrinoid protein MtbC1
MIRPSVSVDDLYQQYLDALREGDRRLAFAVIDAARAAGVPLSTVYLNVLQPAMREIGCLWQENKFTVAQEHLATAITQSTMARLYIEAGIAEPTGPVLVAACAGTERHEIGLRMLCDLLDVEGWQTTFLGASVPPDSLVAMVRERDPDVLALSATIDPHIPQLRDTIALVRRVVGEKRPLIIVGGRPFLERADLAASIGADMCARDAAEAAAQLIERVQ